jgi:tRNA (guanine-N7-)-methyltransferase
MSSNSTIASQVELVPANCFGPLDFEEVFARRAPMEIDLGSGDGSFLVGMAAANPEHDFVGVERLLGRVGATCRRIERHGLTNARVFRFEIAGAVERLLPADSVTAFHILFPDPWPKRRHASRRLLNDKFLTALHRALVLGGTVRIATDDTAYFHEIGAVISRVPFFRVVPDLVAPTIPTTKFERRFLEEAVPIHRISLRKVSPVT